MTTPVSADGGAGRELSSAWVAPWVVQSGSSYSTSSGTISVTLPNGAPVAGRTLVAWCAFSQAGTARTIGTPSGWVAVDNQTSVTDSLAVFTRVVQAGDGATFSWTVSGSSADASAGVVYEIAGAGPSVQFSPQLIAAGTYTYAVSNSVTPNVPAALALACWTCDGQASGMAFSGLSGNWAEDQTQLGMHAVMAAHQVLLATPAAVSSLAWYISGGGSSNSGVTELLMLSGTLRDSDSATGSDGYSSPVVRDSDSDSATGSDGYSSPVVRVSGSDAGTGADSQSVFAAVMADSSADSGTGTDAGFLTSFSVSSADAGTGADVGFVSSLPVSSGDSGTGIEGVPGTFLYGQLPLPSVWEVWVYSGPADSFGTLLGQVPGFTSLSLSPLGDDVGAGSITIPLTSSLFYQGGFPASVRALYPPGALGQYTPDSTPVLQGETLWRCIQDGVWRFDFIAETVVRNQVGSDETQTVTISGPGTAQTLFWGMAMPTGWQTSGNQVTKLSGINDSFSTPYVDNPNAYELDLNLWNLTAPVSDVQIIQQGTVSVNAVPGGAYLAGGPFDASNSSFSASISPVAFGNQGAIVPPFPSQLAQHFASGRTIAFTGATTPVKGSGCIVVVQGMQPCPLQVADSDGNVFKQVAYVEGGASSVVWVFFANNTSGINELDQFTITQDINQPVVINVFSVAPGWSLDTGFTNATGTSNVATLPAQILQSSPELEIVVLGTAGAEDDPTAFGEPYIRAEVDSTPPGTGFQNYLCWAGSGSSGLAEGDPFSAFFDTAVPWVTTGFALYWTGAFAPAVSSLDGSEVTELIVHAADSRIDGYARIFLSFQEFCCEYQDNTGTITTFRMADGPVNTAQTTDTSTTVYDSSWASYWRISCDLLAGNVRNGQEEGQGDKLWRFWTSGDGASWTLQWTVRLSALSFDPSAVNVFVGGSYDTAAEGSPSALVTSVNGEISYSPQAGPIFLSEPAMGTFAQLLGRCQARGTIPWVQPTFAKWAGGSATSSPPGVLTSTADSGNVPWTDSWSIQVPAGTDLLTLLQNDAGGVGADWIMRPGFQLDCGVQGSLGTDKHESIVFHEGEVTELGDTRTRDQIGNIVATSDGSGKIYVQSGNTPMTKGGPTSIQKWHQRERWLAAGGTIDAASAINVAAAGLDQLDEEVQARVIQIPPGQPGKTVFKDFGIFDFIGVERGDFSAIDSVQIIGITVTIDQDGNETDELILQSYRQYVLQYLQSLINKFGGQSASVLGALTAGTLTNGLPVVSLGGGLASNYLPLTGTVGGSSGALGVTPSLLAIPEVATGDGIPGGLLTASTVPASALAFDIPQQNPVVTVSELEPPTPGVSDVWLATEPPEEASNNPVPVVASLSVWNGTGWAQTPIGPAAVAFTATDIGGVQTFVQPTAPPSDGSVAAQSQWFDTTQDMLLNVLTDDGSGVLSWQPYQWGAGAIAAGSLTAAHIAAGTITAQQIQANTITANEISAETITAVNIAANTITAQQIQANTIGANQIAANTVVAGIVDGTYIYGAHFIGDGSSAEFMAYTADPRPFTVGGPPNPAANMFYSLSATGGTNDTWGNPFAAGLNIGDIGKTTGANLLIDINGSTSVSDVMGNLVYAQNSANGASLWYYYTVPPTEAPNDLANQNLFCSIAPTNGVDGNANSYYAGLQVGNQQGNHFGVNLAGTAFFSEGTSVNITLGPNGLVVSNGIPMVLGNQVAGFTVPNGSGIAQFNDVVDFGASGSVNFNSTTNTQFQGPVTYNNTQTNFTTGGVNFLAGFSVGTGGTSTFTGTGNLTLSGNLTVNAGGGCNLNAGAEVTGTFIANSGVFLENGASVTGGTFSVNSGTNQVKVDTAGNLTVGPNGSLTVTSPAGCNLNGGAAVTGGTFLVNSGSSQVKIDTSGNVIIGANGSLTLNAGAGCNLNSGVEVTGTFIANSGVFLNDGCSVAVGAFTVASSSNAVFNSNVAFNSTVNGLTMGMVGIAPQTRPANASGTLASATNQINAIISKLVSVNVFV